MEFLENEDAESALGAFKDEVKEHKDNCIFVHCLNPTK